MTLTKQCRKDLAVLTAGELAAAQRALDRLPQLFGNPHVHSGVGIKKLAPEVFEFRVVLQWRVLFRRNGQTLELFLLGNHDDVRRYLRNL